MTDVGPENVFAAGMTTQNEISYIVIKRGGECQVYVKLRFPGNNYYTLATMYYAVNHDGSLLTAYLLNGSSQVSFAHSEEDALRKMIRDSHSTVMVEREKVLSELRETGAATNVSVDGVISALECFIPILEDEKVFPNHLSVVRSKLRQACLLKLADSFSLAIRAVSMAEVEEVCSDAVVRHVMGA